jgi:hypothetical protein
MRLYWIQVEHFKREGGNVIHVFGLEFDEEHNGEVRFQIYLFLKKLQAFTSSILLAAILDSRGYVIP